MTDLDQLKATFDAIGVKYEEMEGDRFEPSEPYRWVVRLAAGAGSKSGTCFCDFEFDSSGKFVSHGVWE